jgi:hypothetical protein
MTGLTDADLIALERIIISLKAEKELIDRLMASSSIQLPEYIERMNYTVVVHMEKIAAIIGPEYCKEIFGVYPGEDFLTSEPAKVEKPSLIPLMVAFVFFLLLIWVLFSLI